MKLTLKNFQGHEASSLDFVSPGINVIVGESRAGKSAIVRGVEALCDNGTMYRRRGSKETRVKIDGCARVRSSSKNQYEIDGNIYKAMRADIPKELTDKLRLSSINFRPQHQPYFLLNASPGAVAREMNKLADLGMIDYVVGELKRELASVTDAVKVAEAEAKELKAKVESYDWACLADTDLSWVEAAEGQAVESNTELGRVGGLCSTARTLEESLEQFPPTDPAWLLDLEHGLDRSELDKLQADLSLLQETELWLASCPPDLSRELMRVLLLLEVTIDPAPLRELLAEVTEYEAALADCPDIDADLVSLSAVEFPTGIEELKETLRQLADLPDYSGVEGWEKGLADAEAEFYEAKLYEKKANELEAMLGMTFLWKTAMITNQGEIKAAEAEFNQLLAEAGVCPLCRRSTDEDHQHQ